MSTLDDVLQQQNTSSILVAPRRSTRPTPLNTQTNPTLDIALANETNSNNVYAYITGLALNNNSSVFLLQADGVTPYFPSSPSSTLSPLAANCAIHLGAPGSTRRVTIPQLAGARVWFSVNASLTFLLNPGPGLVEPSVTNPSDPNFNITWDFCELTYNSAQVFANITYVDFVALPISLTLTNTSGVTQQVDGLPPNGINAISSALKAQDAIDKAGWSKLIVGSNGSNVRVLSPNSAISMTPSLFSGYYDSYVNAVWNKYRTTPLEIDTQASWGTVSGETSGQSLIFSGIYSWSKPSSADIFNCSSGAFAITSDEIGNIAARLCAGFNRSTLLHDSIQPDNEIASTYYQTSPTNHYSRIVHATNLDGLGYCFPYDDVAPTNGPSQAGTVADGSPQLLTVTVGGNNAPTKLRRRNEKRSFEESYSEPLPAYPVLHQDKDLEKGTDDLLLLRQGDDERSRSKLPIPIPRVVRRLIGSISAKLPTLPSDSPLRPLITFFNTLVLSLLSLSVRQILSRVMFCAFMVVLYLLFGNGVSAGNGGSVTGEAGMHMDRGHGSDTLGLMGRI